MADDKVILKVEEVSKQYRLGLVGTGTLSDDLKRWWYRIRGKADPFLKVGDVNDRIQSSKKSFTAIIYKFKIVFFGRFELLLQTLL